MSPSSSILYTPSTDVGAARGSRSFPRRLSALCESVVVVAVRRESGRMFALLDVPRTFDLLDAPRMFTLDLRGSSALGLRASAFRDPETSNSSLMGWGWRCGMVLMLVGCAGRWRARGYVFVFVCALFSSLSVSSGCVMRRAT